MKDNKDHIPFLARFANALPNTTAEPIRYDKTRQVAQVQINGSWIDAREAPRTSGMTRVTKVANETTDDE
jgi:hypothetical protein